MELEQSLLRMVSRATGLSQQCALYALFLFETVGCLNSNSSSIVADNITVPKGRILYCHRDKASNLHMVKSSGFKIMTPLYAHDAHISGIENAR